jgi:hypothetical protein
MWLVTTFIIESNHQQNQAQKSPVQKSSVQKNLRQKNPAQKNQVHVLPGKTKPLRVHPQQLLDSNPTHDTFLLFTHSTSRRASVQMRSRQSHPRLNPKRWFIDRQQHHRPRLVSEGFASKACENYASETSWDNAHHRRKAETLMRQYFRTPTPRTAWFRRADQTPATSLFWHVLGITACICLGLAPDGLAQTTIKPTALTYYAVQGATNPPNQTLTLSRTRTYSVRLTASDNASWLTVSPTSTSFTTSKNVAVTVKSSGLAAGTYKATITFTVGTWSKYYVPVTLIISPASGGGGGTTSSASLAWNAVTGTTLSGYKVYVGEAPKLYTRTITLGNVTSTTVSSLTRGRTYYFAVTAYNGAGQSPTSNEVSKTIQ